MLRNLETFSFSYQVHHIKYVFAILGSEMLLDMVVLMLLMPTVTRRGVSSVVLMVDQSSVCLAALESRAAICLCGMLKTSASLRMTSSGRFLMSFRFTFANVLFDEM